MSKNNRRIYGLAVALLLAIIGIFAACGSSEDEVRWPAMEELSAWSATNITQIRYTRTTEDGEISDTVSNVVQIEDIYLLLKDVTISGKSDMSVEDDGLDIRVNVGETMLRFSFEGDTLVLEDGGRYQVENLPPLKEYIDGLIEKGAVKKPL